MTSSNAVTVVESLPTDAKILFLPDRFLGTYVEMMTGRKLEIWQGGCHVHEKIGDLNLADKQEEYPEAEIMIHPECGCSSACMAKSAMAFDCSDAHIESTGGMLKRAKESPAKEFVIATETGILHRMRKENPDKIFHPASEKSVCEYMKMITLDKLHAALAGNRYEVKVDPALAERARLPIDRMLAIG